MANPGQPTRERILRAAARRFYLQGYLGTSIDDILSDAGVTKGNFYYHFPSKEAIIYATLDRAVDDLTDGMRRAFARPGDYRDKILAMFSWVAERVEHYGFRGGCPLGNLTAEQASTHEGFRQQVNAAFETWMQGIADVLDDAKASGALRLDVEVRGAVEFVLVALEGAILLSKARRDRSVFDHTIEAVKEYLNLLAAEPAAP